MMPAVYAFLSAKNRTRESQMTRSIGGSAVIAIGGLLLCQLLVRYLIDHKSDSQGSTSPQTSV